MPLKSMAKFAGGWGFHSVSVHSWADGSISAPESLNKLQGAGGVGVSAFSCNAKRSFWTVFETSQETFPLIAKLNLSEGWCFPLLFLHLPEK